MDDYQRWRKLDGIIIYYQESNKLFYTKEKWCKVKGKTGINWTDSAF